ncbi:AAA family ATPase [Gordonia sp. WA4-43]|uniref:AAA family ATPase n=1 Tax=Gordonia sp. WA4-43 TaxID=2878678 RepID=UPI001CFAABDC|nr:AAA family ATPase [Gordonia sp. WA4-43]UCZ90703.1 AAA family ATPase [Gordonia sp. WA4-43]
MPETAPIGEKALLDTVWDLLDADTDLADDAKYLVIAALESEQALAGQLGGDTAARGRTDSSAVSQDPAGAYLREIRVRGFRGIGPEATLSVSPYPGITVISGRNGSGKSSFAEAFEYALTGQSYRWRNKAKLWVDSWRNLHDGSPCEVRVQFTVENGPRTSIGAEWAAGAELDQAKHWSQRQGEKRLDGVGALGWSTAIEIYRPILSYDEIGGLLEQEPSKLYDALDKLLALDEIQDAETRLTEKYNNRRQPRDASKNAKSALKKRIIDATDPRAKSLAGLLRPREPDLEKVFALASGTDSSTSTLSQLKAVVELELPDQKLGAATAVRLRDALANARTLGDDTLRRTEHRSEVLRVALQYRNSEGGDVKCPVCNECLLTDDWAAHTQQLLDDENSQLAIYREAREQALQNERDARELIAALRDVAQIDGVHLATLATYREAFAAVTRVPATVEDLPNHLETRIPQLVDALAALQLETSKVLTEREDTWAPLAQQALEWVALERTAREASFELQLLEQARDWVRSNAQALRKQRLEPIAEGARSIWARLRQESDVDISEIALEGARTRRKAVLRGLVDGRETGVLSVMSQGELHALALARFLPRATAPSSPFRFIVLDDPIQAMDPAKIDGFLNILRDLAQSRQVIVFSHDDRLATTIRQRSVDAHLIEVTRESGSKVVVKSADDPARRYVDDAFAVVADENIPEDIKRRACPGLFRFASNPQRGRCTSRAAMWKACRNRRPSESGQSSRAPPRALHSLSTTIPKPTSRGGGPGAHIGPPRYPLPPKGCTKARPSPRTKSATYARLSRTSWRASDARRVVGLCRSATSGHRDRRRHLPSCRAPREASTRDDRQRTMRRARSRLQPCVDAVPACGR